MIEKHETFYSQEEALVCQSQHKGAEIVAREGHPIMLNGVWTYDIPENRPSWTVCWTESVNSYYYTFGCAPGFPYFNGWVVVKATSWEEAHQKFRARFPDRHENTLNCSFFYDEERWAQMDPEHNWAGWKCHEVIE